MGRAAKRPARVAAGDLELLQILWRLGPSTLAEVHQAMPRAVAYTTVQTRLNRLADKELVRRYAERPARYEAAVAREAVGAGLIDELLERVAGGKVVPLVAQLVADRRLSPAEIADLKELIAQAERAQQGGR